MGRNEGGMGQALCEGQDAAQEEEGVCVGARDWGEVGSARRGSEDLLGVERGRVNRGVPGEGMGGLRGAAERESLGAVMGF